MFNSYRLLPAHGFEPCCRVLIPNEAKNPI